MVGFGTAGLVLACASHIQWRAPARPAALGACMSAVRAPAPAPAAPSLPQLTVYELKAICRAKGLKVSGRKHELVTRIADSDSSVAAPAALSGAAGGTEAAYAPRPPLPTMTTAAADAREWRAAAFPADGAPFGGSEVEVLSAEDSLELEIAERRAQRRQRLQQYYAEEVDKFAGVGAPGLAGAGELADQIFALPYAEQFDELRGQAGERYALMEAGRVDVPIGESGASVRYLSAPPPALPAGAAGETRLAWCSEFDAGSGVGVLVDLQTEAELAVRRALLLVSDEGVPVEARCLYRGEFVEYEHALSGAEQPRVVRVQGIHGWPLMCEAAHMLRAEQEGRARKGGTAPRPAGRAPGRAGRGE